MARYLLCLTGASGAVYGIRLLAALASDEGPCPGAEIHLVASEWAERVVLEETSLSVAEQADKLGKGRVRIHKPDDLASPLSSGSFRLTGTIVAPCSSGSACAIAAGISSNLVQRAAAVALKEGWPLVLVPRETPLSLPTLRAFVALKESGAAILPACPSFYRHPASIDDLIDQVVFRVLDSLGLSMPGAKRWEGESEE
jgi:flavin prenyltransferase